MPERDGWNLGALGGTMIIPGAAVADSAINLRRSGHIPAADSRCQNARSTRLRCQVARPDGANKRARGSASSQVARKLRFQLARSGTDDDNGCYQGLSIVLASDVAMVPSSAFRLV